MVTYYALQIAPRNMRFYQSNREKVKAPKRNRKIKRKRANIAGNTYLSSMLALLCKDYSCSQLLSFVAYSLGTQGVLSFLFIITISFTILLPPI